MKNIWEILNEFQRASTRAEKVEVLRRSVNENRIVDVLKGAFDPKVCWVFKEKLEWKDSLAPIGLGYTNLAVEFPRFYLFMEGHPRVDPNLTLQRKKEILLQILEALEQKEAVVLMNMFLKDLKVPDLTPEIVQAAFPGIF